MKRLQEKAKLEKIPSSPPEHHTKAGVLSLDFFSKNSVTILCAGELPSPPPPPPPLFRRTTRPQRPSRQTPRHLAPTPQSRMNSRRRHPRLTPRPGSQPLRTRERRQRARVRRQGRRGVFFALGARQLGREGRGRRRSIRAGGDGADGVVFGGDGVHVGGAGGVD